LAKVLPENDAPELEAVKALEAFVVENDDLLALESIIGRFNIFDALNIARTEIRHSNFLAFLLDPNESHGQGQVFLNAVLMDFLKAALPSKRPFSPIELDAADLRGVEVRREWNHIDLLISCQEPRFVVAIENKIDATEHSDQLNRYKATINQHYHGYRPLYVYLTPEGEEPSEEEWTPFSYSSLHRVLSRVRASYGKTLGEDIGVFLDHYVNLIGTRFMNETVESSEIDQLCQRIYKNHRVALDLIFERSGVDAPPVLAVTETTLRDDSRWHIVRRAKRYIDFIPREWLEWLPRLGLSAKSPQSWIVCRFEFYMKSVDFYVEVQRMANQSLRRAIIDKLISEGPVLGFKHSGREITNNFTRVSGREKLLRFNEDEGPDLEKVRKAVQKVLEEKFAKLERAKAMLEPLIRDFGTTSEV
jgi:hypothetical protein